VPMVDAILLATAFFDRNEFLKSVHFSQIRVRNWDIGRAFDSTSQIHHQF